MLKTLVISLTLHGSLVGALAIMNMTFSSPARLPESKSVHVSIVTRDEFTRLRAGTEQGEVIQKEEVKQEKKKKRKRPKIAKREATVKKKPQSETEKPIKPKKKIAIPSKKKQVVKQQTAPSKQKQIEARESKKDFVPEIMAALLDKQPFDDVGSVTTSKMKPKKVKGTPGGNDDKLTADDHSYIISKVGSCWNMPVGHLGAENMVVKIDLKFKRNGTLLGRPTVRVSSRSIAAKVVEETAIRAIISCQPYRLPRRKYRNWKALTFVFDPRDMYRN